MSSGTADFSASESALGYIYQIRYGLYLFLSKEGSEDRSLALESLDDITIQDVDNIDLNQTKYHVNRQANLSDRSPDFWKTMRVWSTLISTRTITPQSTLFTLITSSKCAPKSVMEKIKLKEEQIDDLISMLDTIAEDRQTVSPTHENLKGYIAYSSLSYDEKVILLKNITILDGAMDFEDISKKIEKTLIYSTEPKKLPSLRQRLEGWWFNKCIKQLQSGGSATIPFKSVLLEINELQDQLKKDSLPVDFVTPLEISDTDLVTYDQTMFVKQLKLVGTGSRTLKSAISDYFRAFRQRGQWIREDLLNPNEEDRYEQRLADHWKTIFELMEDNLDNESESELCDLGKAFYENHFIRNTPPIFIRDNVRDGYVVRGSCQMLSDRKLIGWHPHFKTKL